MLEFRESDKDLISATHVCHIWRSALTSAPSLWTEVVFQDPDRALTYLTRSGALPIDASFGTWDSGPEDYYASIIPWFDRVQSMVVRGEDEEIKAIFRRLCFPVPLLRSLKLNGKSNWDSTPQNATSTVYSVLDYQAPSLRNLSLDSIPLTMGGQITQLPLKFLTSLTWIDKHPEAEVKDLLRVLMWLPSLELLTLDLPAPPPPADSLAQIVTLSKLRKLTWSNSAGTFSLTSYLYAPKLCSLTIHVTPTRETYRVDLASILPPDRGQFPLLVEPTKITYTTQSGTQLCEFRSPTGYVSVTALPGRPDGCASWFDRNAAISFKKVEKMTIQTDSRPLGRFPAVEFTSLKTLELVDVRINDLDFLQPYKWGKYTKFVPLPTLREVRITFGSKVSLGGLAEILWRRRLAGHKMETVMIRGECDEGTRKAIRNIEGSVYKLELQLTHGVGCTGCELQAGCSSCIIQ